MLDLIRKLKDVPVGIWSQVILTTSTLFLNLRNSLKERVKLVVGIVGLSFLLFAGLSYHQYKDCVSHNLSSIKTQSKWKTKTPAEWQTEVSTQCKKKIW